MTADPMILLASVLEAENAALRVGDFAQVVGRLAEKQLALEAAQAAQPAEAVLRRLHRAVAENRELLQNAIRVQARLVAILVKAAAPRPTGYSAGGLTAVAPGAAPLCLRSDI